MVQLLTVKDVASILRVKKTYVYDLINAHKIDAVRLSERRYRFTKEAVRNYLDACQKN
jgi:excisionase family DNA binding protein